MNNYSSFRDMIDGGGAGAAGSQFQGGGLLSLLANLFATPLGSEQMTRPQARPQMGMPDMQPVPMVQPRSSSEPLSVPPSMMESLQRGLPSVPPVTTTTLPPQGAMPNDDLMRMIEAALSNYGSPGYRTGR